MEDLEQVTYFGATDTRGKRIPFGLKKKDRSKHMYVIGKTGMGKSTLLENMAIQDIRNGEGLAFIDPHGSTADKLLEYVPEHRLNDVVYFAPFDLEQPIAFNVMEDVGYDKRHLVVSGLMATFKKIWQDAWSARMEYILSNTLLALLEYPDATLLGVNRMYTDKAYRKKVIDNVKDPVVKDFWVKEFNTYTDRYTQEATPAIQNKIGQFTSNPLIRNIIGQPKSSFDIRDLMDRKKIIIINLSKGQVGEVNMRLLGSMITTRIFLAAMSRADLSSAAINQLPNFYFYVDEFQNFANETFAEILSEARKYKLNLIIAHQYVEQMEEEVRAAVFGNVGTTVAFRVGPFDAEVLETVFSPEFMKEDLVNLGFAQIYLSLMIDGVGSRPFSATTIPPIEPPPHNFKLQVIQSSRNNFGTVRAKVEEALVQELTAGNEPEAEPAQKDRHERSNYQSGQNNRRPESGQRNNSDHPQQGTAPRQQYLQQHQSQQRDYTAPPQNQKSADDLKAILRTMTQSTPPKKVEAPKPKQGDSLKDALSDVLKKSSQTEPPQHAQPAPHNQHTEHNSQAQNSHQNHQQTHQQPRHEQPREPRSSVPVAAAKPFEVPENVLRDVFKD